MRKNRFAAIFASAALSLALIVSASGSAAYAADSTVKPLWEMDHLSATSSPTGYSPSQIKTAYGIDGSVSTGKGKTIAVIVAFGNPNLKNDLAVFDKQYNLPDANLTVHDNGVTEADSGWALETSMDVEWAHTIAPDAKLFVVNAASDDSDDLLSAVDYAVKNGAQIVSMSWGSSETFSQIDEDSHFSNKNVVFLAATGDGGEFPYWPASSPNVIAVGGTTLKLDSGGNILKETAWSSSSGGTSFLESIPSWQAKFGIKSNSRSAPDVSFDGNPQTGVSVYCSVEQDGESGWFRLGGTSLGAPAWASLIADIDQNVNYIKNAGSLYALAGSTGYSDSGNCFNDIKSGSNLFFRAAAGYDSVTGLGSPQAANLTAQAAADADLLANDATTTNTSTAKSSWYSIWSPYRRWPR